jgi:hypothetical protein
MLKFAIMKLIAQKMLISTNISAKILVHFVGYSLGIVHHTLVLFCQMWLPLITSKIIYAKAALL